MTAGCICAVLVRAARSTSCNWSRRWHRDICRQTGRRARCEARHYRLSTWRNRLRVRHVALALRACDPNNVRVCVVLWLVAACRPRVGDALQRQAGAAWAASEEGQTIKEKLKSLAVPGAPHAHLLPRHSFSHTNLKNPCAEQPSGLVARGTPSSQLSCSAKRLRWCPVDESMSLTAATRSRLARRRRWCPLCRHTSTTALLQETAGSELLPKTSTARSTASVHVCDPAGRRGDRERERAKPH